MTSALAASPIQIRFVPVFGAKASWLGPPARMARSLTCPAGPTRSVSPVSELQAPNVLSCCSMGAKFCQSADVIARTVVRFVLVWLKTCKVATEALVPTWVPCGPSMVLVVLGLSITGGSSDEGTSEEGATMSAGCEEDTTLLSDVTLGANKTELVSWIERVTWRAMFSSLSGDAEPRPTSNVGSRPAPHHRSTS